MMGVLGRWWRPWINVTSLLQRLMNIIFRVCRLVLLTYLQVLADKIYPLKEFRMVKENFLVRNDF